MPGNCLDIIVNIQDYDPAKVYHLFLRDKGSLVVPLVYVIPAGPQYVFATLPLADYETGVRVVCDDGSMTPIVWSVPVSVDCAKATVSHVSLGITITLPDTTVEGFEWRMDYLDWFFVATAGAAAHFISFADINTTQDGYLSTHPNSIVDFQVRVKCSTGKFSDITHHYYVATAEAIGKVTVLKNYCEGTRWIGMALRLSIASNTTDTESLIYNNGVDPMISLSTTHPRTNNMDTDIAYYKALMNGTNDIRAYAPGDPATAVYVSTDFISTVSPLGSTGPVPVPCSEYLSSYAVITP